MGNLPTDENYAKYNFGRIPECRMPEIQVYLITLNYENVLMFEKLKPRNMYE